jgi:hypothetical protein
MGANRSSFWILTPRAARLALQVKWGIKFVVVSFMDDDLSLAYLLVCESSTAASKKLEPMIE